MPSITASPAYHERHSFIGMNPAEDSLYKMNVAMERTFSLVEVLL